MTNPRNPPLSLTAEQRAQLEINLRAQALSPATARRINIILMSANGIPADDIAMVMQVTRSAVYRWRLAFLRFGTEALFRSRKRHVSRKYGPAVVQQIQTIIAEPPPERQRWWTAKLIAARLTGVKHQYISEIVRRMGIDLRAGRRRVYPY